MSLVWEGGGDREVLWGTGEGEGMVVRIELLGVEGAR